MKQQALKHLLINHMGITKTKLFTHESVYWIGMNVDIQNHIKIVLHALTFNTPNQKKK